ncbi:MAG: cob(I)yrinic acid a,c-diamide adenosyltransferase [Elusimicrobia bacterium]|nr:cob(I)yrinic acid a,c-diamide adenosyltransferase [Elusimicrobiota bacterium]
MKKIYTKTGDKGTTGLLTGRRVPKNHPFIEALGSLDEAISALGLARACLLKESLPQAARKIEKTQKALFFLCGKIAQEGKLGRKWPPALTKELEQDIDRMEKELPRLKNFIIPGTGTLSAFIHHSRSVIRRVERRLLPVLEKISAGGCLEYLNRLSDFLFVLARWADAHKKEDPPLA